METTVLVERIPEMAAGASMPLSSAEVQNDSTKSIAEATTRALARSAAYAAGVLLNPNPANGNYNEWRAAFNSK